MPSAYPRGQSVCAKRELTDSIQRLPPNVSPQASRNGQAHSGDPDYVDVQGPMYKYRELGEYVSFALDPGPRLP
jgi:hypothetical protein